MTDQAQTPPRILSAVTVSDSVIFFYGMPRFFRERGMDVAIATSTGPELERIIREESPIVFEVEMAREPRPLQDLASLFKVLKTLLSYRPHILNAGTPKAGFLYILAGWLLRVQIRIYHLRGLRHESLTGFAERLQIAIEKITGRMATHVVCETESLRELALEQGLFAQEKCHVLGPGSSGVELVHYDPDHWSQDARTKMRTRLGIPSQARVIGFVGRLVPRKGIEDLIMAWKKSLRDAYPDTVLLLVGPFEDAQPVSKDIKRTMMKDPRIIAVGKVDDVAAHLAVMDVFTLPAHWEGFGNVVVEAAAMGLPVVTTTGTGTRDAAKHGFNALLTDPKDIHQLSCALSQYLDDPNLRAQHGENGIIWAKRFDRQQILQHLYMFYSKMLNKRLHGAPRTNSE
ncbi:MAG: glycosyltransferase [Hyphomicrobiales bacterium]